MVLNVVSVNVLTLKSRAKRRIYQKQLLEEGIAIVGCQETRGKANGVTVEYEFITIASVADEGGQGGSEVWVNQTQFSQKVCRGKGQGVARRNGTARI